MIAGAHHGSVVESSASSLPKHHSFHSFNRRVMETGQIHFSTAGEPRGTACARRCAEAPARPKRIRGQLVRRSAGLLTCGSSVVRYGRRVRLIKLPFALKLVLNRDDVGLMNAAVRDARVFPPTMCVCVCLRCCLGLLARASDSTRCAVQ